MITYSCKIECPDCGREYYERRLKPYKYTINKMCKDCRSPSVQINGGSNERSCKDCVFFDTSHPDACHGWGKCGKGYTSDDSEDESLDLVYEGDVCDDYQSE